MSVLYFCPQEEQQTCRNLAEITLDKTLDLYSQFLIYLRLFKRNIFGCLRG